MATQIRGNVQIMNDTITFDKMKQVDFLQGLTWNLSSSNDAVVTGLGAPTNTNDATNKAYVDGLVDSNMKSPDGYATNAAGDYPSDYKGSGSVNEGDTFYITSTANGTAVGSQTVNNGDLLVALTDNPGNTDTNWAIVESNRDKATDITLGVVELATQAEVDAGTDTERVVTPATLSNAGYIKTASNGLTKSGSDVQLGGSLGANTTIDTADHDITITNTGTDNTGTITLGDQTKINTVSVEANTAINIGTGVSSGAISLATGMANNNVTIGSASSNGTLDIQMGVVGVAAANNLTLNSLSGQIILGNNGTTAITFNDDEIGAAATKTAIPFAITDSASGTAGKIVDDFRAAFTDEAVLNAIVANHNAITASTVTASNGLTKSGNDIQLGGTLDANTTIDISGNKLSFVDGYGLASMDIGSSANPIDFTLQGRNVSITSASGQNITLETDAINEAQLTQQPDGTVDLAIATTKYVNDAIGTQVINEAPAVTNGSADVTLANTPVAGTLQVYLNGLLQQEGAANDYTVSGTTVTFTSNLSTGDVVLASYKY